MNLTANGLALTMDDYKNHSSCLKVEDNYTHYLLTMKSDVTIDGKYMTLEERVVPGPTYQVAFVKKYPTD